MDVRCEKCGTEYELEDERVTGKGVTVKCTQCGHLFRVRRKTTTAPGKGSSVGARPIPGLPASMGDKQQPKAGAASKAEPAPAKRTAGQQNASGASSAAKEPDAPGGNKAAAAAGAVAQKGGAKKWLIRKASGEIFQFRELTTLQQWIVEEKVERADEISRTGRTWEKLGAIEELESFFMVVDQARAARKAAAAKQQEPAAQTSEKQSATASSAAAAAAVADEDEALPTAEMAPAEDEEQRTEARPQDETEDDELPTDEMEPAQSGSFKMGDGVAAVEEKGPSEMGSLAGGKPAGRVAAWEKEGFRVSAKTAEPTLEVSTEEELAVRRPGAGLLKLLVVVVVGGVIGAGVFVGIWKWEKIVDLVSGDRDKTLDRYSHARALLLKDTETSLNKAAEIFREVYAAKKSARARAGQAEVTALQALYKQWRARYLENEATEIEKKAKEAAVLAQEKKEKQHKKRQPGGKGRQAKDGRSAASPTPAPRLPPLPQVSELRRKASEIKGEAAVLAKQALSLAKEALKRKADALTHRVMAAALMAAGRDDETVKEHLDRAVELKGNDPEVLFVRAVFEFSREQWSAARQSLRQAIAIQKKQSSKILYRAHFLLAHVWVRMGERRKARSELETILSTNREHARSRKLLERLVGKPAADTRLAVAQTLDGGVADAPDAAVSAGGRAATGEPQTEDYDTLVRRGDRYSENGRVSEAIEAYKKALQTQPGGVEALTGLAYCYLDRGRTGKATATFRKALSYSSAYGEALIGLAEIYKRRSRPKKALEYYKKYIAHHPSGRKRGLAQRNIKELEEQLKPVAPQPAPTVDAGAGMAPTRVVVPPPGMDPPTRPDADGADTTPSSTPRPTPRPPDAMQPAGMKPDKAPARDGSARPARPSPRAARTNGDAPRTTP
jgi:predicted Zn finger-like uncharacterized protein